MANQERLTPLQPLPEADGSVYQGYTVLRISEDELQLQDDVCDVVEGLKDIDSFDPEYQKKILNYYRFGAIRQNSKSKNIAARSGDVFDIL